MDYTIKSDKSYDINIEKEISSSDTYSITMNDKTYHVSIEEFHTNGRIKTIAINQQVIPIDVLKQADGTPEQVLLKGVPYQIEVEKKKTVLTRKASPQREICGDILSSLPGLVIGILVKPGDEVKKGQPVILLESMKMENEILSPKAGVVREILVSVGQQVMKNQNLLSVG